MTGASLLAGSALPTLRTGLARAPSDWRRPEAQFGLNLGGPAADEGTVREQCDLGRVAPVSHGVTFLYADPVPYETAQPAPRVRFGRRVRLLIGLLFLLVLMAVNLAIGSGKIQIEKVISESMEPTLLIGDVIVADANEMPRRYDVAVLMNPQDDEEKLVKRVIGMPGDTITIRDGIIHVNGKEEYSTQVTDNVIAWPNTRVHVPPNSVFVIGDNRNNSFDSLNFGPVPYDNLHGVVSAIIWPPSRMSRPAPLHEEEPKG